MNKHRCAALIAVLVAALALLPGSASGGAADAGPPYDQPSKGNQYVAATATQLYVVWSLPRNLAPLAHVRSQRQLKRFMALTALHLCLSHVAQNSKAAPACLVHVLKLATNDEYNTSASGSWQTLGKLGVPFAALSKKRVEDYLGLDDKVLFSLFTRFDVEEAQIDLPQKSSKGWAGEK